MYLWKLKTSSLWFFSILWFASYIQLSTQMFHSLSNASILASIASAIILAVPLEVIKAVDFLPLPTSSNISQPRKRSSMYVLITPCFLKVVWCSEKCLRWEEKLYTCKYGWGENAPNHFISPRIWIVMEEATPSAYHVLGTNSII